MSAPVVHSIRSRVATHTDASGLAHLEPLDVLRAVKAESVPDFVDSIAVYCTADVLLDEAYVGTLSEEVVLQSEQSQGRYWKIGELRGWPVFKQESGLHYMVHEEDGWFMCTDVQATETTKIAWLGNGQLPVGKLHIPFWARKHIKFLVASTQHEYADVMATTRAETEQPKPPVVRSNTQHEQTTPPSGWLNKCKALVEAVLYKTPDEAQDLATSYYKHPSMCKARGEVVEPPHKKQRW